MQDERIRKCLSEEYDEVIIFDNPSYDKAIIGLSYDDRLIYDYDLMVECLIEEGMDYEEAVDFLSYNMSFYYQNKQPIILVRKAEDIKEEY